jgi:hypothetical protein
MPNVKGRRNSKRCLYEADGAMIQRGVGMPYWWWLGNEGPELQLQDGKVVHDLLLSVLGKHGLYLFATTKIFSSSNAWKA